MRLRPGASLAEPALAPHVFETLLEGAKAGEAGA